MPKNSTSWEMAWNSGRTKVVRLPIVLEKQVMDYAKAIDSVNCQPTAPIPQREGDIFLIIQAIEKYIDYKRANYHPNQNSRELDINTRAWDELRKFQKLLRSNPQVFNASDELSV